ncbi:MAG: hypothetical protein V4537_04685 [Pseudomonadota bacterium]
MRSLWAASLLLAGCTAATDGGSNAGDTNGAAKTTPAALARSPAPSPPTGVPTPAASRTADTAEAAADVVRRYHTLIAARDYAAAYALWEPSAVGMTAPAFAASFAKYASYAADVGRPGRIDAGAGQRYVTVPVRVTGRLASGGGFALVGTMTLHRTGDIDGATAEQRSWRIRSSDLKPRPGETPVAGQPDRFTTRYRCIDGSRLVAAFDVAAGAVTLRRGGERLGVLQREQALSGAAFAGDGLTLRDQDDAATFGEPGKPPIACRAIR